MELSKFLLSFLILIFPSSSSIAQEYPDAVVHKLLKTGIEKIIKQDYDEALSIFTKMKNDYPTIPLGKIYIAATHIARSFDYGEQFEIKKIESLLDDAYNQAKSLEEKDSKNIWYKYFAALAEGYSAYFEAIQGNYFSAMSSGLSSVDYFEECIEFNPDFYEAFVAIGTYKYWKSRKTEFLNWLPFVSDNRESGVNLLETAIEHSSYNSHLAVNSLIWIYIDQDRGADAVKLVESALKEYPECRIFKWGLGRAYEDIDRKKAISIYDEILQSYPPEGKANHLNEIMLKHKMAQQYEKLGEKNKALKLCNEILSIKELSAFVKEELGDRLKRVEELRKKLMK